MTFLRVFLKNITKIRNLHNVVFHCLHAIEASYLSGISANLTHKQKEQRCEDLIISIPKIPWPFHQSSFLTTEY